MKNLALKSIRGFIKKITQFINKLSLFFELLFWKRI